MNRNKVSDKVKKSTPSTSVQNTSDTVPSETEVIKFGVRKLKKN